MSPPLFRSGLFSFRISSVSAGRVAAVNDDGKPRFVRDFQLSDKDFFLQFAVGIVGKMVIQPDFSYRDAFRMRGKAGNFREVSLLLRDILGLKSLQKSIRRGFARKVLSPPARIRGRTPNRSSPKRPPRAPVPKQRTNRPRGRIPRPSGGNARLST